MIGTISPKQFYDKIVSNNPTGRWSWWFQSSIEHQSRFAAYLDSLVYKFACSILGSENSLSRLIAHMLHGFCHIQVDAYDNLLVGYQKAAVNTEAIASVLNAGQGTILAIGLTGVIAVAAATAGVGTFTAGDLVNIYLFESIFCKRPRHRYSCRMLEHSKRILPCNSSHFLDLEDRLVASSVHSLPAAKNSFLILFKRFQN